MPGGGSPETENNFKNMSKFWTSEWSWLLKIIY